MRSRPRRDQNIKLSGSFGSGVEVESGDVKGINIAGGANSGDHFQFMKSSSLDPFDEAIRVVDSGDFTADQKTSLSDAVTAVRRELDNGNDANLGLIEVIFSAVGEDAPSVLPLLAQGILEKSESSSVRRLAQQVLNLPDSPTYRSSDIKSPSPSS
jgi:hypothetical protein